MRSVSVADADDAVERFAEPLWRAVLEARAETFTVGAQFAAEQAAQFGYAPPEVPMAGYSPESVKTVLREEWRGDAPWERVAERLESHVRDASRQAVFTVVDVINEDDENDSTLDDEWGDLDAEFQSTLESWEREVAPDTSPDGVKGKLLGWARVLSGDENCAFCVMLASRGPVFESAYAAGKIPAPDTPRGWANRYHDNCDCAVVAVPASGRWAGAEQAKAAKALYDEAVRNIANDPKRKHLASGKKYRENLVLQEIDRILREREEAGRPLNMPAYAA